MKPEELRGRELAAYTQGWSDSLRKEIKARPDIFIAHEGPDVADLCAAEIERLCADEGKWIRASPREADAAARDAAALDEIAAVLAPVHRSARVVAPWQAFGDAAEKVGAIIERTGRRIGGGT